MSGSSPDSRARHLLLRLEAEIVFKLSVSVSAVQVSQTLVVKLYKTDSMNHQ